MSLGLSAATWVGLGSAALGAMGSGDSQQSTEQKKTPWEPAQPWMKANLQSGQDLQQYMQKNPFNAQQQTGYQNLFGGIDQMNQQIAPGLMGVANGLMGSSYQRQRGGAPGSAAGYGGAVQPGGLMRNNTPQVFPTAPQGPAHGLLNFEAMNPYSPANAGGIAAQTKNPEQMTNDEIQAMIDDIIKGKTGGGNSPGSLYGDAGSGG